MGMASSQVRLLFITNRIHDIEYKAACLQNAKILLAMLEDDAYQNYLAALEGANTITIGGEAAGNGTKFSDLVNGLGVYMTDTQGNVYASAMSINAYNAAVGGATPSTDLDNDFKKFAWYMDKGTGAAIPDQNAKMPTFVDKLAKEDSSSIRYYYEEPQNVSKEDCIEQIDYYEGTASNGDIVQEKANGRTVDSISTDYEYATGETDEDGNIITKNETITLQKHVNGYEDKKTGYIYSANYFEGDGEKARKDKTGHNVCILTEATDTNSINTNNAVLIDTSKLGQSVSNETFFTVGVTSGKAKVDSSKYTVKYNEGTTGTQTVSGVFYIEEKADAQKTRWENDKAGAAENYAIADGEEFYSKTEVDNLQKYNKPDSTHYQVFKAISDAYDKGKAVSGQDFDANTLAQMLQNGGGGYQLQNKNGNSYASLDGDGTINYDPKNPFNYSVSSGQDKAAVAAASAEYEHELKKIDNKEKQYDTELAKLETERTALTTELEGLKKVINDNIERTFGIFS